MTSHPVNSDLMKDVIVDVSAAGRVHLSFWVGDQRGHVKITADLPGDSLQADLLLLDAALALRKARLPVLRSAAGAEDW